jgi:hypothetical protein
MKRYLLVGIILISFTAKNYAQFSGTMYHMGGIVPQANLMNPAFQPTSGFYLGLPGVSPLSAKVSLPFSLSDAVWYDNNLDSTVSFLHPEGGDLDYFKNRIRDRNILSTEVSTNIASFGFRTNNLFFSIDIRERISSNFILPGDFLLLLLEGNKDGDVFDLSHFGLNFDAFMEYGVGVSWKYSEQLSLGARGKFLFGQANISTKSNTMNLETSLLDSWILESDLTVNASLPFSNLNIDSEGKFDFENADFNTDDLSIADYTSNVFKNLGLGLDLGAVFKPIDQITLSASVVDFGYIRWNNTVYNLRQNSEFVFEGINFDSIRSDDFFDQFVDTLINEFDYTPSNDPYTSFLSSKIYLGFNYHLSNKTSFGVVTRSQLYKSKLINQVTFSANLYPTKVLVTSFSYTIQNYSFNNLGFALGSTIGPFNMYFIFDNIPIVWAREVNHNYPIPHKLKDVNLKLGFNLVFGTNKKKKLLKDKPMLE